MLLYAGEKQRTKYKVKVCEHNSLLLLEKHLKFMSHWRYMTESPFIKRPQTGLTTLLGLYINARMEIGMQTITAVFKPLFWSSHINFVKLGKNLQKYTIACNIRVLNQFKWWIKTQNRIFKQSMHFTSSNYLLGGHCITRSLISTMSVILFNLPKSHTPLNQILCLSLIL